jgi:signal transduction histidine kinase
VNAEPAALGVPVGRVSRSHRADSALPRWIQRILAVPLAGKLAGANGLIVVAAIGTAILLHRTGHSDPQMLWLVGITLGISLAVNIALVSVALRPLRHLERTAELVSHGNLAARVPSSVVADRDMVRIGRTFNTVLDELITDRALMRRLAAEVIRRGDKERAVIGKELHDSAAQELAALMFQVSAVARESTDPNLSARLETIRGLMTGVLEQVVLLAQVVHPRVLDDLGLPAALQRLARETTASSGVPVEVEAMLDGGCVPPQVASILYRVAEEAVANAVRHGAPKSVQVMLTADARVATLEVRDDGRGFDVASKHDARGGVGLFTIRERVALADGSFQIESGDGAGTRIRVSVPLTEPPRTEMEPA